MATTDDQESEVTVGGDEDLNERATDCLAARLSGDEEIIAVSGFDFATKILCITDQRILVTGDDGHVGIPILDVRQDDIDSVARQGRTLTIRTIRGREFQYGFAEEQTVEKLVEIIQGLQVDETLGGADQPEVLEERSFSRVGNQTHPEEEQKPSIAERVRFWEEQDKINQELILRVIRQSELLTNHIAEHDNLPEVAGEAISQALAGAREEQRQRYDAALEVAKRELAQVREEQRQQFEAALGNAKQEFAEQAQAFDLAMVEQSQRFEAALEAAKRDIGEQTQSSVSRAVAHLQTTVADHKTELSQQAEAGLNQGLATLREESRKIRISIIGIAAVAAVTGIAAIIVSLFT